jgi:hypothetical protein
MFHLEDPIFRLQRIQVLTHGATKYGLWNWRNASREQVIEYFGAQGRHINEMERGNYIDKETGLPHAAHASVNLEFIEYFRRVYGWEAKILEKSYK